MVGQGPTDGQQDDALDAWQAAGTDEVMLPTGTAVRMTRPSFERLAREGLMTGALRAAALRDDRGGGTPTPEDQGARERSHALVGEHLLEFRPPGREWTPAPPEVTAGDLSKLPPIDRETLVALVLHARTPRYVDTTSRVALNLIDRKEAGAILRDTSGGIGSWAGFRHERPGLADGADGSDVRPEPQPAPRRRRSGRGVSARRGADAAPGSGTTAA